MKKEKKEKQQNVVVTTTTSKKSGWLRKTALLVVFVLIGSFVLPIASGFSNFGRAIGGRINAIVDAIDGGKPDPTPDEAGTNEGQTTKSKIISANIMIKNLDPAEDMPETFDEELLATWENGTSYAKTIVKNDSNGKLGVDLLLKVFEDEALEKPLYVYAKNIEEKQIGWKLDLSKVKWWQWGLIAGFVVAGAVSGGSLYFVGGALLSGALAGLQMNIYDSVAKEFYISSNGLDFQQSDATTINMKKMYFKNMYGNVVRMIFNSDRTVSSLIFKASADIESTKKVNSTFQRHVTSYIGESIKIEEKNNIGRWVESKSNAGFLIEINRIGSDILQSSKLLNYEQLYAFYPLPTTKTKFAIASDGLTLFLPDDEKGIEDFTKQGEWGYKKYIEYSFDDKIMLGRYKAFAIDSYKTKNALTLRSRLKSKFFAGTNIVINKSIFNLEGTHNEFLAQKISDGIQIITLPYSLKIETGKGLTYQFEITQYNSDNLQVGDTLITTSNELTRVDFDNENFVITFDNEFKLNSNAAYLRLRLRSSDTVFENAFSTIIL